MIYKQSPHNSDRLFLTRWELIQLFFGKTFQVGALYITAMSFGIKEFYD